MSHVAKLSLAVVLALVAAMLNVMWLSAEKRPATFVAANTDLAPGTVISDGLLMAVPVPGDFDKLKQTLIPYGNRALLFGLRTPRTYVQGDVFFQRDIEIPLEKAQFEVIGPFRLISVGERFKQASAENTAEQASSGGDSITIAMDANFDEKSRQLLEILDPTKSVVRGGKLIKIIAIQVVPKDQSPASPAGDNKNVVYQTVSLTGIASVPRVLLEGDWIRFVIPSVEQL